MNRSLALLPLSLATLFCACSTTNQQQVGESDPNQVVTEEQNNELEQKRRDFRRVLLKLDQGMDSYVTAMANRGDPRADHQIDRITKLMQDTVLDMKAFDGKKTQTDHVPGTNYRTLQALAKNNSLPDQQAIALAALGFSGDMKMMSVILQGAQLSDPFLVDRAVLGLAVLKNPKTPTGVLTAIVENPKHPEDGRAQAAWAIYQIQTVNPDQTEIAKIWSRFLGSEQHKLPASVISMAIRGLGLTGDAAHAEVVLPMLKHPTPRLRMAASVALGRMNAQKYWRNLLELLKPQESNPNVRLCARKALARLAGDRDYTYDVAAWQKVFERGEKEASK